VWVVSGWKTLKRAAALRQNFIALLAYIYEPYSSRSKLFPTLPKLESIRGVLWGFAPRLCGKAAPFRPNAFLFLLIRAAGRQCLPAARMWSISGSYNGKAQPFRTASGEAAGHRLIAGSNLDKSGARPTRRSAA
jgi:hypothetical protein